MSIGNGGIFRRPLGLGNRNWVGKKICGEDVWIFEVLVRKLFF